MSMGQRRNGATAALVTSTLPGNMNPRNIWLAIRHASAIIVRNSSCDAESDSLTRVFEDKV